jgi:putative aminopeptidase FrvX
MAAATWGDQWRGKRIRFFNDCEPIVHAVTKGTSRSPLLMTLIRQLFFVAAEHEFEFRVEHIRGVTNNAADALSRLDQVRFRSISPGADHSPTIPSLPPVLDC